MAIVLPKFSSHRSSTGFATETQPAVNLSLCRDDGVYIAGNSLTAKWRITRVAIDEIDSLEASVLWYTEGKGDEDLHVHHFIRLADDQLRQIRLADVQSTDCVLPATPLSYQGQLISLCWGVRVRIFLVDGREFLAEQPFHLVSARS